MVLDVHELKESASKVRAKVVERASNVMHESHDTATSPTFTLYTWWTVDSGHLGPDKGSPNLSVQFRGRSLT